MAIRRIVCTRLIDKREPVSPDAWRLCDEAVPPVGVRGRGVIRDRDCGVTHRLSGHEVGHLPRDRDRRWRIGKYGGGIVCRGQFARRPAFYQRSDVIARCP